MGQSAAPECGLTDTTREWPSKAAANAIGSSRQPTRPASRSNMPQQTSQSIPGNLRNGAVRNIPRAFRPLPSPRHLLRRGSSAGFPLTPCRVGCRESRLPGPPGFRGRGKNLFLGACAVLVALLMSEIGLRVYQRIARDTPFFAFLPDDDPSHHFQLSPFLVFGPRIGSTGR